MPGGVERVPGMGRSPGQWLGLLTAQGQTYWKGEGLATRLGFLGRI